MEQLELDDLVNLRQELKVDSEMLFEALEHGGEEVRIELLWVLEQLDRVEALLEGVC